MQITFLLKIIFLIYYFDVMKDFIVHILLVK